MPIILSANINIPIIICFNVPQKVAPEPDASYRHQWDSSIIVPGYLNMLLERICKVSLNLVGTNSVLKHSPQIFSIFRSALWEGHSRSLTLACFIFQKAVLFFVWDHFDHLTIKPFSRRHLACPCGQLGFSVELEDVDFGAGASFLGQVLVVPGLFLTHAFSGVSPLVQ